MTVNSLTTSSTDLDVCVFSRLVCRFNERSPKERREKKKQNYLETFCQQIKNRLYPSGVVERRETQQLLSHGSQNLSHFLESCIDYDYLKY